MRHQRHGLEAGAAGVAVRAADALAVGRQRPPVEAVADVPAARRRLALPRRRLLARRVRLRPRRRPARLHLPQRVRVEVRHHPAERRVRRRRQLPRARVPPRPQRPQLLLRQRLRAALRRRRPRTPRQPRQHHQRQHRRQPVHLPLAAPAVRQLREQVPQRTQFVRPPRRRPRLRRTPLRALLRIRQTTTGVRAQRPHVHLLARTMSVRVLPVVPREALRPSHRRPVRRQVARALEPRRVHERLRQLQRMSVRLPPVRAQTPQTPRQRPRRQTRRPRRLRQHQEPRVVPDQVQTPELHLAVPAQPAIPRPALERPRLPAHQRHPATPPLRHVPQTPTRELPEAQVVVLRHQRVPAPPLLRPRRTHHHLPYHHVHAFRPRFVPLHAPLDTPFATG